MSYELESHLDDHARSYQQGHGGQFNVEHMYIGDRSLLPVSLLPTFLGPLVRESDPLELGVHRAAIANGNAVPPYIPRDIGPIIMQKMSKLSNVGGLLLVVGDSTAGKSRISYESLLRTVPDHRLIAPFDRDELRFSLGVLATSGERQVLWLENLERFLGPDGLTPRITSYLRHLKIMIVASMRTEHFRRLSSTTSTKAESDSGIPKELIASEHVIKQADVVVVDRRWSRNEAERAATVEDTRIREALQYVDVYGVAEYLAAGPMLYKEWRLAWEAGQNPCGAALVQAAVDCYRAGVHDFVPLEVLRDIYEPYLEAAGGTLLRPEPFDAAIAWAAQRRAGVTSLLLPGKANKSFRAFDYLADRVMLAPDRQPVPDAVWNKVQEYAGSNSSLLEEIAIAATSQDKYGIAESIWKELAASDNAYAAFQLGKLYIKLDRDDEAQHAYEHAVELGELRGATALGHLYTWNDDLPSAEQWYEQAALGGDPHGMYHMGIVCLNRNLEADAEGWFRKALEMNEVVASSALGGLLVASGRLDEAESTLRKAAKMGDVGATVYLGTVLVNLDRNNEAEELWLKMAEDEVGAAEANLALLYRKQKRFGDSELYYKRAIAHGRKDLKVSYGTFLAQLKRTVQASKFFLDAIQDGDVRGYKNMARLMDEANRNDETIEWFKKSIAHGDESEETLRRLADACANAERMDDAVFYWQKLAGVGNSDATYALGRIKRQQGDADGAMKLLKEAAEQGDGVAACQVGQLYWGQHDDAHTVEWLKRSYDIGHPHAACLLGSLYYDRQDYEKAEAYWSVGYKGGHTHLASDLATLFVNQGRGQEAAIWLRRANNLSSSRKGRIRSRPPRRKKRR